MKRYALLGAAGYIAPRHLKAIKDTGGTLIAAMDPSDSVGVLDRFFPDARFFTEFERFDRFLDKIHRKGEPIEYLTICSPNYLHDAHIRYALRYGAHAICEKPMVVNSWNLDGLLEAEEQASHKVHGILQLRLHSAVQQLKLETKADAECSDVDLTYVTSRGRWYDASWKGDESKSGGIATNIGIHFFDMLHWIFGDLVACEVHLNTKRKMAGYLRLERARVRWFLSIDGEDLPKETRDAGQSTYRNISINGDEFDLSHGFSDLHTASYEAILRGEGFGIGEMRAALHTVGVLRKAAVTEAGSVHPLLVP